MAEAYEGGSGRDLKGKEAVVGWGSNIFRILGERTFKNLDADTKSDVNLGGEDMV